MHYAKPRPLKNFLQSLQEQLLKVQLLILTLKTENIHFAWH